MTKGLDYFLPYQVAWINDQAPVAIIEKSRRIGITYAEAYRSVERRIRLGTHHYFASRDRESAALFLDDCKTFAKVFGVVAEDLGEVVIDEEKDLKAFVVRFANGARIHALSSNPDVFRSKGGDITLDEFAFHKKQKLVLKAAQASARIWGHQIRIISTHNGEGSLFNLLIIAIRAGKRKWSLHRVTLQDAVDQGLVEKIRKLKTVDLEARKQFIAEVREGCIDESEWLEEYCCVPNTDEGAYLSYDLIDACTDPSIKLVEDPADLPAEGDHYGGYDVGRRHDLSAGWVMQQVGDVYWLRMLRVLAKQRFSSQQSFIDALMRVPSVRRLCIDETGLGMQLAETSEERWRGRVEGVTLTAVSKAAMAPRFKGLFEDRKIRIAQDDALREDLHKTRKIVTAGGNVRLAADSDNAGHADRFWAGVLASEAASNPRTFIAMVG